MRAIVTPTHDSRVGILDGEVVASFPDGCPEPGEYDIELAPGSVNTTGERRRLVTSCQPVGAPDEGDTDEDEAAATGPIFGQDRKE